LFKDVSKVENPHPDPEPDPDWDPKSIILDPDHSDQIILDPGGSGSGTLPLRTHAEKLNFGFYTLQGFCPDSVQTGYDRDITKDTTFRLMCMVNLFAFNLVVDP